MPSWLDNPIPDNPPPAAKALSCTNAEGMETTPGSSGAPLLKASRAETPDPGRLAQLVPFAPVALRLLRLFDADDAEQAGISRLVEADPALTAEILSIVNSALYPIRGKITSPAHGVAMLGLDMIKALTTTLAMRAMLSGSPRIDIVRRFWRHSIGSAAIAHELAPWFGVDTGLAYVAAVVHDIGRIGLLALDGEAYSRLATASYQTVEEILEVERVEFGMDHSSAGLLLSQAWGFPETLRNTIANHHQHCRDRSVVGLIQLACGLADAFMFQSIQHRDQCTPAEAMQTCVSEQMQEDRQSVLERLELISLKTIEAFDF